MKKSQIKQYEKRVQLNEGISDRDSERQRETGRECNQMSGQRRKCESSKQLTNRESKDKNKETIRKSKFQKLQTKG